MKNKKGFTIIELLAVVVVLALLIELMLEIKKETF